MMRRFVRSKLWQKAFEAVRSDLLVIDSRALRFGNSEAVLISTKIGIAKNEHAD